jgi:hypothetical protein
MRKLRVLACLMVGLFVLAGQAMASGGGGEFRATLLGSNEVPPRETAAHGSAQYHVANDELSVSWKLHVTNIENVVAGHIHLAPEGVNGPVVVNLVSATACRTLPNGLQCSGTFTAADLVGPLAGHPLSDLLTAMENGGTYTNVHTTQYPGGEVRGQNGHGNDN